MILTSIYLLLLYICIIGQGRGKKKHRKRAAIDEFLHMYDTAYWVVNKYVMLHTCTYIHTYKGVFNVRDSRSGLALTYVVIWKKKVLAKGFFSEHFFKNNNIGWRERELRGEKAKVCMY